MRARLQAVSARVALEQQKREGAKGAVLADAQGAARVRVRVRVRRRPLRGGREAGVVVEAARAQIEAPQRALEVVRLQAERERCSPRRSPKA